jgi:hypothetical protein
MLEPGMEVASLNGTSEGILCFPELHKYYKLTY